MAAVKKACAGGQCVSQSLGEKLVHLLQPTDTKTLHDLLSDPEFEVMRLFALGKRNSEIAEIMHLGVTTVSTYRARILQKLHLKNNAELMRYAVEQGITSALGSSPPCWLLGRSPVVELRTAVAKKPRQQIRASADSLNLSPPL